MDIRRSRRYYGCQRDYGSVSDGEGAAVELEQYFRKRLAAKFKVGEDELTGEFLEDREQKVEFDVRPPDAKPYNGGYLVPGTFRRFLTEREILERRERVERFFAAI